MIRRTALKVLGSLVAVPSIILPKKTIVPREPRLYAAWTFWGPSDHLREILTVKPPGHAWFDACVFVGCSEWLPSISISDDPDDQPVACECLFIELEGAEIPLYGKMPFQQGLGRLSSTAWSWARDRERQEIVANNWLQAQHPDLKQYNQITDGFPRADRKEMREGRQRRLEEVLAKSIKKLKGWRGYLDDDHRTG